MDTNDTSDVILASMLNVNIAEVSKIPPDLRIVLISKFESMRNEIDLKRDDIQDRKLTMRHEDNNVIKSNAEQEQQCSSEIINFHQQHHSSQTTATEDDFPGDFSFGFPTAADALASEAAFMENIGLYLNPKPALSKSHGNKTPNLRNVDHTSPDAIENDFLLLVAGEGGQQSNIEPVHSIESSISKSRHQQSLLSFLNKAKPLTSTDNEDLENKSKDDHMDQMEVEGPSSSLRSSWKLWNDQNGPDIWDDLFSSTAEEIYNIENNGDNDASLMEAVELVEKIANNNNPEERNNDCDNEGKYFCVPCNRSLSGRDAYYRHTLSELHFKRTLARETTGIEEKKIRSPLLKRHKPNMTASNAHSLLLVPKVKADHNSDHQQACPCCKVNIPDGCLGKHLVSHFHYHRSLSHPDHKSLILSNISDIVKQAPFQCGVCKFYCNFSRTFLEHWKSQHQSQTILENDQRLWCSTCRVSTTSEAQMLQHLQDANHLEIETMINRSVPIVIKSIQLHQCGLCPKRFRLNFSLKLHMASSHSETEAAEADRTSLKHKQHHLHCRICHKKFKTSNAYRLHKLSKTHFAKLSALRNDWPMTCHLCGMESLTTSNLNEHMISGHLDFVSQCYTCGELFPIPQQLAAHIRNYCNGRNPTKSSLRQRQRYKLKEGINCNVASCEFVGKNLEVTQLHEAVVHRQSLSCFKCQRTFQSSSKLFHHLLGHRPTAERCGKCSALFSSKFQAENHQCHSAINRKKYVCQVDKCQYVTDKLSAMKSHLVTHQPKESGKGKPLTCPHCAFSCSRPSQLKRHVQQIHQKHLLTTLQCPQCTYSTFSQQHLLRHRKNLHPGDQDQEEVFHCRLCSFSCSNLDNLRKHILKTKKHPQAKVYNCHLCSYSHNSMLDFRGHLIQVHHADLGEDEASTIVRLYFTVKTT